RPFTFRPYRGLTSFQPEHARFFCGRVEERRALIERIESAGAEPAGAKSAGAESAGAESAGAESAGAESSGAEPAGAAHPRFQVVAGASGTGKSSLVMAGVLPALRAKGWLCAPPFRPGKAPLRELMRALRRIHADRDAASPASLGDARSAADLVRALPRAPGAQVLVVVDQLEELFFQGESDADKDAFLAQLAALTGDPKLGVVVVATLRIDAFSAATGVRWQANRRLYDLLVDARHTTMLRRVGTADFADIISTPARRAGLSLEEGLSDSLLRDVEDEPGGLPLLEYTLDQLWEKRRGSKLTHDAYRAVGGGDRALGGGGGTRGVLVSAAERLVQSFASSPDVLAEVRSILLQLVDASPDTSLDTRRQARFDRSVATRSTFAKALDALAGARLVVVGHPPPEEPGLHRGGPEARPPETEGAIVVDLAHEALIRHWRRLREWIDGARTDLTQLQELRTKGREGSRRTGTLTTSSQASPVTRARALLARAPRADRPRARLCEGQSGTPALPAHPRQVDPRGRAVTLFIGVSWGERTTSETPPRRRAQQASLRRRGRRSIGTIRCQPPCSCGSCRRPSCPKASRRRRWRRSNTPSRWRCFTCAGAARSASAATAPPWRSSAEPPS
ncbi:MAG: hypothetical protein R3F14_29345, partial [Polyangiaceae bacterium]